jgi:hypothetical protein
VYVCGNITEDKIQELERQREIDRDTK